MSYKDFEQAKLLLGKAIAKLDIPVPSNESEIANAEEILGVKFPRSYSEFLKLYGYMGLGSEEIYGLINGAIIKHTLYQRKINKDPDFPMKFIPIYDLGNGEKSCLDTSQMNEEGECPVMAWYFGATEKIAEDFGEFLLEKVKQGLESLENSKEKNLK